MATDPVVQEYDRLAHRYEARWGHYVRTSTERTLSAVDLRPGIRLLDVGCGTGTLLDMARRREPTLRAAGVDLSLEMLGVARRKLPPSVGLLRGDVQFLPFGGGEFDTVVSASSFHYWPDPLAGLLEVARVLRPGGQLVVTDWCDDYLACRICDRVLRVVNRAHRRIYGVQQCVDWLARAGFERVEVVRYKIDWLWGLMTVSAISSAPTVA